MNNARWMLLAGVATMSMAQAAHAQTDTGATTGSEDSAEIVVTAQKRAERLVDVPISISVMTGEQLDSSRADGVSEALNAVPGVAANVAVQGGGTQVTIRGVAPGGSLFTGASPTAYYIDGMPFGLVKTAIAPDTNGYDLDRVEVLRGPQGTLYGANALNGVVRILTHEPNLDRIELKARGSISTTRNGGENFRGDTALNLPLLEDKIAIRAVLGYQDLSGWIGKPNRKNANDAQILSARVKLLARPTEQLELGLSAWISRSDLGGPSISDEGRRSIGLLHEPIRTDYDAFSLKIGYDLGAVSLTSVTSHLRYANDSSLDILPWFGIPDTPLVTNLDSRVFSQEITLGSNSAGPFKWTAGGIYRRGKDRLVQTLGAFLPAPIDFTDISRSWAVFGELTYELVEDRLELTGGLRYFEDRVSQIENVDSSGGNGPLIRERDTFRKLSPRLILTYHPSRAATVYASYSEGYRSGFNQNPNTLRGAPGFPPLKADTLKNYEIGAKGALLDGHLNVNAAAYYIDWINVQQTATVDFGGAPIAALVNGPSASGLGVELGITLEPIDRLTIGANYSWNGLEMDRDLLSNGVRFFAKGDRLISSPEHTLGASAKYWFPIGAGDLKGIFDTSTNYISEQSYRTVTGVPPTLVIDTGEAYWLTRASFAVSSEKGWSVTLFADNLFDSDPAGARLIAVPDWAARIRPRTIGLQFEGKF
jgi:outer membrane receptor protein involved in Fe transport